MLIYQAPITINNHPPAAVCNLQSNDFVAVSGKLKLNMWICLSETESADY